MNSAQIGKAIRQLRLRAGYTQHELASCLNVTDKAVSKWERGLSIPDISIVMLLSNLLNCDVDNLLEGNITYLEQTWQGLLILPESGHPGCGTTIYGKPLVYILLSYFVLAGIKSIYVSCGEADREFIRETIGDGARFGISLTMMERGEKIPPVCANTMAVVGNVFIYGPNLTRYFQRAISRKDGITVLTLDKAGEAEEQEVFYDNKRAIIPNGTEGIRQKRVPVFFFPQKWFREIGNIGEAERLKLLYAEPMDNGMIEYMIRNEDDALDTAAFFRYIRKKTGKEIYDLTEVAKNRNFIE